jgi:flagellar FliJ protein
MSFKFRLEKVLRVRRLEEDQARDRLLCRQKELKVAEGQLKQLRDERSEIAQFGYAQSDLVLRVAMYKYLERLDDRILKQSQVVADCQKKLAEAQDQWLDARRKKEVLEKLREKRFNEYRREEERALQKVLDDMGSRVRA